MLRSIFANETLPKITVRPELPGKRDALFGRAGEASVLRIGSYSGDQASNPAIPGKKQKKRMAVRA
jgi:hypothetical protein